MMGDDQDWSDTRDQQAAGWTDTRGDDADAPAVKDKDQPPSAIVKSSIRYPTNAGEFVGDALQSFHENIGGPLVQQIPGAIAGDQVARQNLWEGAKEVGAGLGNEFNRMRGQWNKTGESMYNMGSDLLHGNWLGASGDLWRTIYHGAGVLPIAGGPIQSATDRAVEGQWGKALGESGAFLASLYHPDPAAEGKQLIAAPKVGIDFSRNPAALDSAKYLMDRGVRANAAAATDSPFIKGLQKVTESTPTGAVVGESAFRESAERLNQLAGEFKRRAFPKGATRLSTGEDIGTALNDRVTQLQTEATAGYDKLKRAEADPANIQHVQVGYQTLPGELERLKDLQSRWGALNPSEQAELQNLTQRQKTNSLQPPMQAPLFKDVGLPADLRPFRAANRDLYNRIGGLMKAAGKETSQSFAALSQIMEHGDAIVPASTLEEQLGAIKGLTRDLPPGRDRGLAKMLVPQLQDVVDNAVAAAQGGDALGGLEAGRAAAKMKGDTLRYIKQLKPEKAVGAFKRLVQPEDANIEMLRTLSTEAPGELRKMGRAWLNNLFTGATKEGGFKGAQGLHTQWEKLGPETKRLLFDPALAGELDKFFLGARKIAENPNPSGSATTALIGGSSAGMLGGLWLNPVAGVAAAATPIAMSKFLHSPAGVRFLTEGLTVPINAPRARVLASTIMRLNQAKQKDEEEKTKGYDEGGYVDNSDAEDDDVLRRIAQRRSGPIRIGSISIDPAGARSQSIELRDGPRPSNAPAIREADPYYAVQPPAKAEPAPAFPPAPVGRSADEITNVPRDTSFSDTMAKTDVRPQWMQQASNKLDEPFVSMPVTGGSPMELSDIVQIPQSKLEVGLMAAGMLPGGKILKGAKGARKIGTAMLEGAAPEAGLLSKALENAPRSDITAKEVLDAAAQGPGKFGSFASYMDRNPTAGEGLFDISNAQPSLPGRSAIPRYDPSEGRGRGPSARVVDAFNNPKVIEGLRRYVTEGAQKLPEDWYANDPLYKVYQREWGPQAEDKFFNQMGYQAATSTGSAVPDNIRTGSYYNYMAEQGIPFPDKPAKGYGSKYQVAHRDTAQNLRDTGGIDAIANPKRGSFTENLMGNEDLLTADKHFMRLVGMLSEDPRFLKTTAEVSRNGQLVNIKPQELFKRGELTMEQALKDPNLWVEAPNANEYLYLENHFRDKVAKPLNYTVADAQGKAWVGAGDVTGLGSPPETWIKLLRQRVQYTADRLNVDPQVILKKFVRGEIPLLELGVGAAGLGALSQSQASGTDRTGTDGRP